MADDDLKILLVALAETVRQFREKGRPQASQEALGLEIGMDRSYWGALERGEHQPRIFTLWRLARALKVSPDQLVRAIDRNYKLKAH